MITSLSVFAQSKHIPKDSKSRWDFRAAELPLFLVGSTSSNKLSECKTYEDLRDTLKKCLKEVVEYKGWSPIDSAYSCKLALIRTHYILGEIEEADKLLLSISKDSLHLGGFAKQEGVQPKAPLLKNE